MGILQFADGFPCNLTKNMLETPHGDTSAGGHFDLHTASVCMKTIDNEKVGETGATHHKPGETPGGTKGSMWHYYIITFTMTYDDYKIL